MPPPSHTSQELKPNTYRFTFLLPFDSAQVLQLFWKVHLQQIGPALTQLAKLLHNLGKKHLKYDAKLGQNSYSINSSGIKPISTTAKIYSQKLNLSGEKLLFNE